MDTSLKEASKYYRYSNLRRLSIFVFVLGLCWGSVNLVNVRFSQELMSSSKQSDARAFYLGGMMLIKVVGSDIYDLNTQIKLQNTFVDGVTDINNLTPFINPPWVAVVWLPLAFLPFTEAYKIAVDVNLIIAIVWMVLCLGEMKDGVGEKTMYWLMAIVAYFPFVEYILQTQMSLWIGLIYWGGKKLLDMKNDFYAGMVLSLLTAKPHFAIVAFLFLVIKKKVGAMKGMILGSLILGLVSVGLVGVDGIVGYINLLKNMSDWNMTLGMRQNVEVAWRGLLGSGIYWWIAEGLGWMVMILIWLKSENSNVVWTALLVGTLLLAVHANAYDLAILSLPAVWWIKEGWGGKMLVGLYLATGLTTILVDNFKFIQIGPIALFVALIYLLVNVKKFNKSKNEVVGNSAGV